MGHKWVTSGSHPDYSMGTYLRTLDLTVAIASNQEICKLDVTDKFPFIYIISSYGEESL